MWTRSNGQRLKFYRALHNMTQDELSSRINVSKQHLGEIERGVSKPSLDLVANACKALEIDPINLFLTPDAPDSAHPIEGGTGERRSRLVVGSAMWVINLADGKQVWSRALYRLLRLAPTRKPSLKLFLKRLREPDVPVFTAFYEQLDRGETPSPITCALLLPDGTHRRLHVQADLLHGGTHAENGQALALFMDVTEGMAYHREVLRRQDELQKMIEDRTRGLAEAVEQAGKELRLRTVAEREVRAKKDQLERLLAAVPAIIYSFAPEKGGMGWHSRHMRQIFGCSFQDFHADPMLWFNSIHEDDRATVQEAIAGAEAGRPLDVEYRIRTKSGGWRRLRDMAASTKDTKGRTILSGVAIDVTEHREAEAALRESEGRFRMLFEKTLNPIFVMNEDGRYIDANASALAFLECELAELIGKDVWDFAPPAELERMQAMHSPLTTPRTRETVYLVQGKLKTLLLNIVPQKLWGQTFLYGIGQDITKRKEMEQAIRDRENELRAIIETTPDGFGISKDGIIQEVNQALCAMHGYERSEMLGRSLSMIVADETPDVTFARLDEVRAGKNTHLECLHRRKDGGLFPVEVALGFSGSTDGRSFCFARDISARKQADQKLRRISELLQTTSRMARIGGWGKNLLTGEDEWSEVTREIHEVGPDFVPEMHNSIEFYKEGTSRDTIIKVVARLIETGEPYDVEVEFITAKGRELWVRTMGQAEFQDGRCVRIYGILQDITERKSLPDNSLLRK